MISASMIVPCSFSMLACCYAVSIHDSANQPTARHEMIWLEMDACAPLAWGFYVENCDGWLPFFFRGVFRTWLESSLVPSVVKNMIWLLNDDGFVVYSTAKLFWTWINSWNCEPRGKAMSFGGYREATLAVGWVRASLKLTMNIATDLVDSK